MHERLLRAPQQQEAVAHGVRWGGNRSGEEVAALEVAAGNSVGVPGSDKGGAGEPAAKRQVGTREQQQAGPAHKNETVALQPVIEDVKPSPPSWCAPNGDRHGVGFTKLYKRNVVAKPGVWGFWPNRKSIST